MLSSYVEPDDYNLCFFPTSHVCFLRKKGYFFFLQWYLPGTGIRYSNDSKKSTYFPSSIIWYNLTLHIGNIRYSEQEIHTPFVLIWQRSGTYVKLDTLLKR